MTNPNLTHHKNASRDKDPQTSGSGSSIYPHTIPPADPNTVITTDPVSQGVDFREEKKNTPENSGDKVSPPDYASKEDEVMKQQGQEVFSNKTPTVEEFVVLQSQKYRFSKPDLPESDSKSLNEIPEEVPTINRDPFRGQDLRNQDLSKLGANWRNLAGIRKFLLENFDYTALRALISDDPRLKNVLHKLSPYMGLDMVVQHLLEYAERKALLQHLVEVIKEKEPDHYAEHQAFIETEKLPPGKIPIRAKISLPPKEVTVQIINRVKVGIADRLNIPSDQIAYVHIQPKRELTYNFNTSVEEYIQSTLIVLALPQEKANELIQLNRAGRLEEWKKSLKIDDLKIENNLDRYIEVIADLALSAETSPVAREDKFRVSIVDQLGIAAELVCFVVLKERVITFGLILPEREADQLIEYFKADKLKDFGIQDFKIVHLSNGRKEILFKLIFPAFQDVDAIFYPKSTLAAILATKISNSFGIELNQKNILWHNDQITFTFAMPSINVSKLFHYYRTKKVRNILNFEIQDLQIGRYDWENYLGLIVVDSE